MERRVRWEIFKYNISFDIDIQWNLYEADTFGTFPSVRLIEVVKIAFVNDQHSMVTLYCNKVACCLRNYPEFKFIIFHHQL